MSAILTEGLAKVYPNGKGIFDVNLDVGEGEIFGYLGPNGAGKTTTIRTLLGLLHPAAGRAAVLGHDIMTDSFGVRAVTGYLSGDPALYGHLTGEENIRLALRVRRSDGWARARELSERLQVPLNQKVRHLSRGQRQKVALILAMAHRPKVLFLDEPTASLDPLIQEEVYRVLREEKADGTTVFMSSHNLKEVERTCERVGIIRAGRIAAVDTVEALTKRRLKHVSVVFGDPAPSAAGEVGGPPGTGGWRAPPGVDRLPGVSDVRAEGRRLRFNYSGNLDELTRFLAGHRVLDLNVEDPGLEEVFRAFYASDSASPAGGEGSR